MAVLISNTSPEVCTLPYPLQGILKGGQRIILSDTLAALIAACPSIDDGALLLTDLGASYAGPNDDTNFGLVSSGGANVTLAGAQTVTGQKTFSAAQLFASGTEALPGISFSGDTNMGFRRSAADTLEIVTAGADRWQVTSAGHLMAVDDNTYDIGAAGATRPRTGYFGTSMVVPTVGPVAGQQHTLPAVASDTVALLAATQTLSGKTLTTPNIAHVRDAAGAAGWSISPSASAVNGLVLENSATGVYVSVVPGAPSGSDANLSIRYRAKGTGAMEFVNPANTAVRLVIGATGMGFFGAAETSQPAAVADAAGGAVIDAEARTALNALLARLRTLGIIAT